MTRLLAPKEIKEYFGPPSRLSPAARRHVYQERKWGDFVRQRPEHKAAGLDQTKDLTMALAQTISEVGYRISLDADLAPDLDAKGQPNDTWSLMEIGPGYPRPKGDCEDFTFTQRLQLLRKGVPASILHPVAADIGEAGELHMMLCVVTRQTDLILDIGAAYTPVSYQAAKRKEGRGVIKFVPDGRIISL